MNIKYIKIAFLAFAALALTAQEAATVMLVGQSTSAGSAIRKWTLYENGQVTSQIQAGEGFRLPQNRSLMLTGINLVFRGHATPYSRGATVHVASRTPAGARVDLATLTEKVPAGLAVVGICQSFPSALPVPAGVDVLASVTEVRPETGLTGVDITLYGYYGR